jgi:hypothetical protein
MNKVSCSVRGIVLVAVLVGVLVPRSFAADDQVASQRKVAHLLESIEVHLQLRKEATEGEPNPASYAEIATRLEAIDKALAAAALRSLRKTNGRNSCVNNLRILDAAKEQAAMEHKWGEGKQIPSDSAAEESVLQYVRGGEMPQCPDGGEYTLNPIGEPPTCSVAGHKLP